MNAYNEYSERFLEIINVMGISDYSIWNNVKGITKERISQIRRGVSGASLNIISAFCSHYTNVNANYIITGRGSIFISTEELPESNRITNKTTYEKLLEEYTRQTEELLSQRDKEIRTLQLENARLKAEAATKEAV
jgi:hypothetical protein